MSTDLATFSESELKMRYKEPFLTAGLNKKLAVAVPSGIYRGFRLAIDASAGDRTVDIQADSDVSDHVAIYLTETDGYALTIRRTSGDFLVLLTAYDSETVILALHASYTIGGTTSGVLRAYTEAEYAAAAEKDELLVLGKVDVPAAGNPIEASMVHQTGRSMAWQAEASDAVYWAPLVKNPSFEWATSANFERSVAYWELEVTGGSALAEWQAVSTSPRSGVHHLQLWMLTSGTVNGEVRQKIYTRVWEGQRLRVRFYKRASQIAASGTLTFSAVYTNDTGVTPIMTTQPNFEIDIDLSALDSDYVEVEAILEVPSGYSLTHLKEIKFAAQSLEYSSTGAAVWIDDVQVWLETTPLDRFLDADAKPAALLPELTLFDPTSDYSDLDEQALLRFVSNMLRVERRDEQSGSVTPVGMQLFGQLLGIGSGLLASPAEARNERISAPFDSSLAESFTLLFEAEDLATGSTNQGNLRIWLVSSGLNPGIAVTINCSWNGSVWSQDDATEISTKMVMDLGKTQYFWKAIGGGTWDDLSWDGSSFGLSPEVDSSWISAFLNGSTLLGNSLLSTEAEANTARLIAPSSAEGTALLRTFIFHLPESTLTTYGVRIYRSSSPTLQEAIEFVVNASWNVSTDEWDYDDSGENAFRLAIGEAGFFLQWYNATDGWAEGDWYDIFRVGTSLSYFGIYNRNLRWLDTTAVSNPPAPATMIANQLYAKNIIKGWAIIESGSGTPTVLDSFNLNQAGWSGGGNQILNMNVLTDLNSDNYTVVATVGAILTNAPVFATVFSRLAGSFQVAVRDEGAAVWRDLSSTTYHINLIVIGEQDS